MKAFRRILFALVLTVVVTALVVVGLTVIYGYNKAPLPLQEQCVARVQGESVALDLDQAHYASIIAGVATRQGLEPRATTIALATAYQESGLHNLDYGDRDSLGLFQQRPSQGWGTQSEVMDPWYSAGAFYDALVKVPAWSTTDINDVAQAVQRSGHPNGYARHVDNARRVASSLTGETPASFSCLNRQSSTPDAGALASFLDRTLPDDVTVSRTATGLELRAPSNRGAWSAAAIVVANAGRFGVQRVGVANQTWQASRLTMPSWSGEADNGRVVEVTLALTPSPSATP